MTTYKLIGVLGTRLHKLLGKYGIKFFPIILITAIATYAFAFYQALLASPPDVLQGEYVRIMYVHVPSAWIAVAAYVFMGTASIFSIFYDNPVSGIYAYAIAPIGASFCFICLVTGALWGKPVWGVWWVWDPRLTSMLILMFLYLGYIAIWDHNYSASRSAAILNVVGLVNIPIIKYSVELWNSIHQTASITMQKISIDTSMLIPLFLMLLASLEISFCIWVLRLESIKTYRRKHYRTSSAVDNTNIY